MKYLQKITETVTNPKQINDRLIELSNKQGKAWVFSVMPFSHTINYYQYPNPSSVPDSFLDTHAIGIDETIANKGRLVGFTKAAIIRDQQRGYTADR